MDRQPVHSSFQASDPHTSDPQKFDPAVTAALLASLQFNEAGLIPAVAQDWLDGAVLMVAWMNREAIERTLASGEVHYWSRSRQELWHKGATSGHFQSLKACATTATPTCCCSPLSSAAMWPATPVPAAASTTTAPSRRPMCAPS
jgi:phosphoribosyl-ATP pyrophosphohydrolase/phosphoribosyl-AMP cyclohydrolase